MSLAALATSAVTFLAPYLIKGGESLASGVGKDLWSLIKKPFQKKESHKETIKELEEKPGDQQVQGKVMLRLQDFLEEDPEFAKELEALVKKAGMEQNNNTYTQTITGTGNIGIQGAQNNEININK